VEDILSSINLGIYNTRDHEIVYIITALIIHFISGTGLIAEYLSAEIVEFLHGVYYRYYWQGLFPAC